MRKNYQKEARGTVGRIIHLFMLPSLFFISQDELDFWSALPLPSFLCYNRKALLGGGLVFWELWILMCILFLPIFPWLCLALHIADPQETTAREYGAPGVFPTYPDCLFRFLKRCFADLIEWSEVLLRNGATDGRRRSLSHLDLTSAQNRTVPQVREPDWVE